MRAKLYQSSAKEQSSKLTRNFNRKELCIPHTAIFVIMMMEALDSSGSAHPRECMFRCNINFHKCIESVAHKESLDKTLIHSICHAAAIMITSAQVLIACGFQRGRLTAEVQREGRKKKKKQEEG